MNDPIYYVAYPTQFYADDYVQALAGKVVNWQTDFVAIALYNIEIVDMAKVNVQDQLREEIREHVAECLACKVEVMELLELKEAIRAGGER